MEKRVYTAPQVSITKWEAEDIITTSGVTVGAAPLTIDTTNDAITTVSYGDLAE